MNKIILSDKDLQTIADAFSQFKDCNRGDKNSILPIMKIEQSMSNQTAGRYKPDTTYDIQKNALSQPPMWKHLGFYNGEDADSFSHLDADGIVDLYAHQWGAFHEDTEKEVKDFKVDEATSDGMYAITKDVDSNNIEDKFIDIYERV